MSLNSDDTSEGSEKSPLVFPMTSSSSRRVGAVGRNAYDKNTTFTLFLLLDLKLTVLISYSTIKTLKCYVLVLFVVAIATTCFQKDLTGFGFFLSVSETVALFKHKLKEAEFGAVSQARLDPIGPLCWSEPLKRLSVMVRNVGRLEPRLRSDFLPHGRFSNTVFSGLVENRKVWKILEHLRMVAIMF